MNKATIIFVIQYLGTMEEIHGRTLLEEESVIELPVIIHVGFVGVPGQTLPLTVTHPQIISMLKRVIEGDHTFGILTYRYYLLLIVPYFLFLNADPHFQQIVREECEFSRKDWDDG